MFLLLAVLRCGVAFVLKVYIFFFLIQVDGGSEKEVDVKEVEDNEVEVEGKEAEVVEEKEVEEEVASDGE